MLPRASGPRDAVALLAAVALLSLVPASARTPAAELAADVRVVREDPAGVTFDVRLPAPRRSRRGVTLHVAVPPGSAATTHIGARVVAGVPLADAPAGIPTSVAAITGTGTMRDVDYVRVALAPVVAEGNGPARRVERATISIAFGAATATRSGDPAGAPFAAIYDHVFRNDWRDKVRARTAEAPAVAPGTSCLPAPTGGASYRIKIPADGIYRIGQADLLANTNWNLGAVDPRNIQLWETGSACSQVAIRVQGQADGSFDSADYIELYGRAMTGESVAGEWQSGDYTDERAYYLVPATTAGSRALPQIVDAVPGPAPLASFRETLHFEGNGWFDPFVTSAGEDVFMWKYAYYAQGSPGLALQDHTLAIPGAATTGTVTIDAVLRGRTSYAGNPDHHTALLLNGTSILDWYWDGPDRHAQTIAGISPTLLSPTTTLTLKVYDPTPLGNYSDGVLSSSFDVTYDRLTQAVADELTVDAPSAVTRQLQIENLTTTDVSVYDVTNPGAVKRIVGGTFSGSGPYTLKFNDTFPFGGAKLLVVGAPARRAVASFRKAGTDDLRAASNGADWLVIGPKAFIDPLAVPELGTLAAHRQGGAGGALRTRVVNVEDVYDQFGRGTVDPLALRDFLAHAYATWTAPAPTYVVLLGDASADYKNGLGYGSNNFVPSHVVNDPADPYLAYHTEDSWYGLLSGADNVPELLIGRVPARTVAEARAYLAKAYGYEAAPDGGSWRGRTLFVTDSQDATYFEPDSDAMAALVTGPGGADKLYFGQPPWSGSSIDVSPANGINDIVDRWNDGALVTSYLGHGSFDRWSGFQIMTPSIVASAGNGGRLTVVLNGTCYIGAFHNPITRALMEDMVLAPGKCAIGGGAESTWSWGFEGVRQVRPVIEGIYGPSPLRGLGALLQLVRIELDEPGNQAKARGYVAFGDPAERLAMPLPAPASALQVTGVDDRRVDLAWTASPAPGATYGVRRALAGSGSYQTVASAVAATTYSDTTVTNLVAYDYVVVAVDAEGFWSAASNVATATPENPSAPAAPGGLTVTDLALGRRLDVSWSASPETDVTTYHVSWRQAPAGHWSQADVAVPTTTFQINGLTDGLSHDVRVSATNDSLKTSPWSPLVSATPTHTLGYAPPRWISDLKLQKSGSGVELGWTRPSTNVYGDAETAINHSVYRGYSFPFAPDRAAASPDRAASPTCPTPGTCTAVVGLNAGAGLEVFYVTAYDASGEESPIGHQMPDVVPNVSTFAINPTITRVSWSAVATDASGAAATITGYRIYRGPTPHPRPDYTGGTNLRGQTQSLLFIDNPSSPAEPDYSVVAVDEKGNPGPY